MNIILFLIFKVKQNPQTCESKIYDECTHQRVFSEQEIEIARLYLQARMQDATYKPIREHCSQLRVRRDFKCLTEEERQKFIDVIKQLYLRGDIQELAKPHRDYWREIIPRVYLCPGIGLC